MWVLLEASKIFSTSLGSLVYHLLLLLAVEAALGIAWGERRRGRREQARRLMLAMVGLAVARAAYVAAALLVSSGWVHPETLLPPFERFADTVSIGLLGWAFLPPSKRGVRAWDLVFGASLVLAVGAAVVLTIFWGRALIAVPTLDYNVYWQAIFWTVWQMILIPLAVVAAARDRKEGWGIFLAAMLVMFVGRPLQLALSPTVPHLPVWERLTNLVAYPLIAVAVYQNTVAGLRVHSRQLQDISQASMDQIKSLLFLFEASQQMSGSLDLSTVLGNAVRGVARALDADQCAIAFLEEGGLGQMRLAAIHNPTRKGRGESVTFPLEYQLTVQQSMRRKKPIIVAETENVQLKVLFALLGSSDVGPLLVQPLVMEGEAIGAIIAGNSRSRRPFTPNEAKLCQSMADQLVGAIENANRYNEAREELANLEMMRKQERTVFREATERVQELTEKLANAETEVKELQQREEAAREARNALEIQLMSSRAEMDTLSERLVVLEGDLAQAHASAKAQMRWYEEELTRQEGAWQDTAQIAEWIQTVLQSMMAGLLVVDAEGVIQRANVASGILLGQDIEELQGLPVKAVSDDERWQQAVAAASNGEAVRVTMQVASSTLMCDLAPSADSEDDRRDANPVTVILQDVSAEAEEKRARLEKISAMAENLRTPVTTVISYADLLLSETVGIIGDVQRKFLLRMKAGAERIIQMIDDLSQEAGGEERWTLLQRESVDVTKLVEAAVASSHVQLEDKSLTVELDLSSDLPTIQADPDYLRRVLSNLLSNACLASSVGGRVEVKASQSDNLPFEQEQLEYNGDGFVIVSVKDSGGGLSEDAFHRIFDQGRPSQTPLGLGESGAGLALTKTLVEAHGGRLWVENHSGIGATFSVVLPVDDREVEPHRKNLGEPST